MGLRKSLPTLHDLSRANFDIIMQMPSLKCAVTEKTDGFAFEVGRDSVGTFFRSGSSVKCRKMGDFANLSLPFVGTPDYNPLISLRMERAMQLLKDSLLLKNFFSGTYISIAGEMILEEDDKLFSPNGSNYNIGYSGSSLFVIHTKHEINQTWHYYQLSNIIEKSSGTVLVIDDDVNHSFPMIDMVLDDFKADYMNIDWSIIESRNKISSDAKVAEKKKLTDIKNAMEHRIYYQLSATSKWGGKPEGYVLHLPEFKFKVMISTQEYTNRKLSSNFGNYKGSF